MEAREFLEILHVSQRLKDTTRHCTTAKGRPESVAEHSWRLSLMALLLRDEFPDLDTDKVVAMCLIHDLGECFTGDIPSFDKTDADAETEDRLLREWAASLPPEVSARLGALYDEMDALATPEAKLYKALDKMEAVVQHNEAPLGTWEPHEYELNKTYAFDAAAFSPWLTSLREEILRDTLEKIGEAQERTPGKGAFELRRFTEKEIPDVLAFEKKLREEEDVWGWEIDEKYVRSVRAAFSDARFGNAVSFLAYEDGAVVGRIDAVLLPSFFDGSVKAYLDWICVLKSRRHRGAAQALLARLSEELKSLGADTLIALTASNDEAQRFYQSIPNGEMHDLGIWSDLK